jgi:hypothetical protein
MLRRHSGGAQVTATPSVGCVIALSAQLGELQALGPVAVEPAYGASSKQPVVVFMCHSTCNEPVCVIYVLKAAWHGCGASPHG